MSAEFIIGQRWISHNEPQLGLGIVIEISGRLVTMSFPAVAERRIYATEQSSLNRVEYKCGDEVTDNEEQKLTVIDLHKNQGLIIYNCRDENGNTHIVPEIELNSFVSFMSPLQRLFNFQIDSFDAFKLRIATIEFMDNLQRSPANGLIGTRTNLLPHQLFITHEVSKRFSPRVMLADEVGLGKTIEAGMILHQQLHMGYINRVLIVVPPSLIHQWLVEMLRRFNLHFSIIDEERVTANKTENAIDYNTTLTNPLDDYSAEGEFTDIQSNLFETEQLIICPIDLFISQPQSLDDISNAGFDMLVVDEAHHLEWTQHSSSIEYESVRGLCEICPGVLLLTATPESIDMQSYFAQLSLLDPSRFYEFEVFKAEQNTYSTLANLMEKLIDFKQAVYESVEPLSVCVPIQNELEKFLPTSLRNYNCVDENQIASWISYLVDVHGTSRILFRNTRSAIGGFQERELFHYALENPDYYASLNPTHMLYPEVQFETQDWLEHDPRVAWLVEFLNAIRPAKVLLICSNAKTAIELEHYLQLSKGISSAAFHEHLSIIERDRAAAYFADEEQGAQILICSEIGSEGRNFQFSNQLVLFDLPLNPDLLEQRIGRLDRIGQTQTIHIHVPYLQGTAQELLFLWYQQGLNQFTKTFSSAKRLFDEYGNSLHKLILKWPDNTDEVQHFLKQANHQAQHIREQTEQGKDKLLEYNSCRMDVANTLIHDIKTFEKDVIIDQYMYQIFDVFNIDYDDQSENIKIIAPIENVPNEIFSKLKTDRLMITTDRETALVREDIEYLSFEHPLVEDVMEMIMTGDLGNVNIASISLKNVRSGSIFMEAYFAAECISPKYYQLQRFLPYSPLRFVLDEKFRDIGHLLTHDKLNRHCKRLDSKLIKSVVTHIRPKVEAMLSQLDILTQGQINTLKQDALKNQQQSLELEIDRLCHLQKINSSVRDQEIEFFNHQIESGQNYIARATYKLQAIRIILNV